ncbi:MAG: hypothetical protein HZA62_12335 [Rhodocyclales bacterium]|nr:hypothetical protein [Rhodocyclales bacterium]
MKPLRLLPLFAIATLLALMMAVALLMARRGAPALGAHIAFALGVMPLILAAMSYFVPVLTRGPGAAVAGWLPPLLALGGGGIAVAAFAIHYSNLAISLAALLAISAAFAVGAWTLTRARRMIGRRHPGMDWYLAALGMLLLALFAVMAMPVFPEQRAQLRVFHLHANLLGFVGLTALGTLQVLLPTCIGKADPDAACRLRADIKWVTGACLMISIGAASLLPTVLAGTAPLIAVAGAVIYLAIVLRVLCAWWTRFRGDLFTSHGAAPSLLAATVGLFCLLILGLLHGWGYLSGRASIVGFVVAFLLPLVSGAMAQLLPVWLRPGVQAAWHAELRYRLCRWGGVRGFALLLTGLGLAIVF